jgi:hypothetical protein
MPGMKRCARLYGRVWFLGLLRLIFLVRTGPLAAKEREKKDVRKSVFLLFTCWREVVSIS